MGYYAHKSIIVTGESHHLDKAYKKAVKLFSKNDIGYDVEMVLMQTKPSMNGLKTFIVVPDGSKEGWELSDFFDKKIEEFIKFLNSSECKFSDGSSYNSWVVVEYGETGRRILKSNCKNKF